MNYLEPKSIGRLFLLSLIAVFYGCGNHYDRLVESDYSFQGRFGSYDSYQFVVDDAFEGTSEQKVLIEEFIDKKLGNWGYKKSEKKPDLIVLYRLYYDDFQMKGYEQPSFEQWLTRNFSSRLISHQGEADSVRRNPNEGMTRSMLASLGRENYDLQSYELREGTILISFYDRRAKKTIWQGYASGVFNRGLLVDNFLKNATLKVLNQYRILSKNSFRKNRWFKHGFQSGTGNS